MGSGIGYLEIYTTLTVCFATTTLAAFVRRNGSSTLAMAFAGVLAAHLARFPSDELIVSCTILMVALTVTPGIHMIGRLAGARGTFWTATATTAIVLLGSISSIGPRLGIPEWNDLQHSGSRIHVGIAHLMT